MRHKCRNDFFALCSEKEINMRQIWIAIIGAVASVLIAFIGSNQFATNKVNEEFDKLRGKTTDLEKRLGDMGKKAPLTLAEEPFMATDLQVASLDRNVSISQPALLIATITGASDPNSVGDFVSGADISVDGVKCSQDSDHYGKTLRTSSTCLTVLTTGSHTLKFEHGGVSGTMNVQYAVIYK
jgi:hypothetical protein